METGAINSPAATAGTIDGATHIQTPSRVEHGPGGVFVCEKGQSRTARKKSASAGLAAEVRR